jgi:hypothetical protein
MFQVSPLSPSISLSLYTRNASAMADIIPIKTEKTSLNLLEHQNVTNYTPTADTVQLDVHVARIAKDKTYIFTSI